MEHDSHSSSCFFFHLGIYALIWHQSNIICDRLRHPPELGILGQTIYVDVSTAFLFWCGTVGHVSVCILLHRYMIICNILDGLRALSVEVTCDQPSRWWHKEQPLCPHCHTAIHVHTLPSIKLLNSLVSDASIIDGFNMPILTCDIMKRNWSWVASHKPYKVYSIPGIIKLHWIQRTLLWLCPDRHKCICRYVLTHRRWEFVAICAYSSTSAQSHQS